MQTLQEAGRRAGTENVLGIVGLGAAAEIVTHEQEATSCHMASVTYQLQDRLLRAFPQVTFPQGYSGNRLCRNRHRND